MRPYARWVMAGNLAMLLAVTTATLLCDANGRLPGLDETLSAVAIVLLTLTGVFADGLLLWCDPRRWLVVVMIALVYAALLFPGLLSLPSYFR